jgi:hypothetical protein
VSGRFGDGAPMNDVNTPGDESEPFDVPDGSALYFAATRANNVAAFVNPKRVDSLGTDGFDIPSYVTSDQCEMFLTYKTSSAGADLFHAYRQGARLP